MTIGPNYELADESAFRIAMERQGKAKVYIDRISCDVRRCLIALGDRYVAPSIVTAEDIGFILSQEPFRSYKPPIIHRNLSCLEMYLEFAAGNRAVAEYRRGIRGITPEEVADEIYADALARYCDHMARLNLPDNVRKERTRALRKILGRIAQAEPGLDLGSIGQEQVAKLMQCGIVTLNHKRGVQTRVLNDLMMNVYGRPLIEDMMNLEEERWLDSMCAGAKGDELRQYHAYLSQLNYSPRTVRGKIHGIRCTMDLAIEMYGRFEMDEIDELWMVRFAADQGRWSNQTIKQMLSHLGHFVAWYTGGQTPYNGTALNLSDDTAPRRFLTESEWVSLMRTAEPVEKAIVVLGSMLGMRRHEMALLRVSDFMGNKILIRGKGFGGNGKTVMKPVDPVTRRFIEDYLEDRERIISRFGDYSDGMLLIMANRNGGCPLTDSAINHIIGDLAARTRIPVTPHMLRRFYCMSMYERGVDVVEISKLMRHSDVSTTYRAYIDADTRKMESTQEIVASSLGTLLA